MNRISPTGSLCGSPRQTTEMIPPEKAGPCEGRVAENRRLDWSRRTFVLGSLMAIAGCGTMKSTPKTSAAMTIQATDTINPSSTGLSSPVLLRIFTLKTATAFLQHDFGAIFGGNAEALGDDLVGKREYLIQPGATIKYEESLPPDVTVIGIVAGFRSIDTAQWRAQLPVKTNGVNHISVKIDDINVTASLERFKSNRMLPSLW